MKYLRLYESVEEISIESLILQKYTLPFKNDKRIELSGRDITTLKGKMTFDNVTELSIMDNSLSSFEGIENYPDLKKIWLNRNKFTNLKGIEICQKLIYMSCIQNKVENLKGLDQIQNFENIGCYDNELKNLDELENLSKLTRLFSYNYGYRENPLEKPISYKLYKQLNEISIYGPKNREKFRSYEFQKEFLEENPEKVIDLIPIGFNDKINEEYKDLKEFFNIKN